MRFISSLLLVLTIGAVLPDAVAVAGDDRADGAAYASPYRVRLPWPDDELIPDLFDGERGDPRLEASIAQSAWYGPRVGAWGPWPRAYLPPAGAQDKSDDWKRARIVATALRFLGYDYRHHHIPDWNPPAG